MPVQRIAAAILPILFCLCAILRADTVVLKSGEKVEGKILSETDAEVTVSVQVTATIKDERVIKRADIGKIEKVQPDEIAWLPLANLAPGSESLERDEYDRVKAALTYFTGTFPKSPHTALAQSRLDQFFVEQARVAAGEVKLNGEWLSKEKVQEEHIQIQGHILLNRMKRAASAGQPTEAMAFFDQLEKNYSGSASYPEAIVLGRRVLASLWPALEQRQVQLKRHMEDEDRRLMSTSGAEHAQLDAMIKRDLAVTEATITAIERAGGKWFPLQPANARSLTALASRVTAETTRLNSLPVEKMQDSIKASEAAAAALKFGNLDGADKALKDAMSAWPTNELAKRLLDKLADAKKAVPAPKSGAATPTPVPTTTHSATASAESGSAPAAAPVASAETDQSEETPIFKRPIFFIALTAVVAFGAVAGKMVAKSRAAAAQGK